MNKLTAANLVAFVNQLDRNATYNYLNAKNKGLIQIVDVETPEGPIKIKRWDPNKNQTPSESKIDSISSEMIWRIANSLIPNHPISFDRILGASYNTRSVFEAILANTPQFNYCYPGRIENINGRTTIKNGHKHIIWMPENPHRIGITKKVDTDIVISEIPTFEASYDALVVPPEIETSDLDIDVKRRHAQIQIALYFIGYQLKYKTWIANNDKGILYQNKRIAEFDGVISSLRNEDIVISKFQKAVSAAMLIDCIWFKNGSLMPAVMEIEHSTGVTSGLVRMKNLKDNFPGFITRYVIVAPDEIRDKVIREANKEQFKILNTKFFPYSAVEELYALCQRRKIKGITEEFLDCYMETVLEN